MIVRYVDDWSWDLTMYLHTLDIQILDARTGELLANGGWKNSAFHGFYGAGKVTEQVVADILTKMANESD